MERESGAKEEHQETAWETRGPAAAQVAPRGPPLEPEVLERRRPLATLEIRELELDDAELRLEPGDSGSELAIREPEHAELRLELEDSGLEPEDNGQCALGALHF